LKSNNQFSHGGDILAFSKKIDLKPKKNNRPIFKYQFSKTKDKNRPK
jgi:hypothetical protein